MKTMQELLSERDRAIQLVERYYWVTSRKQGQKVDADARSFLTELDRLPSPSQSDRGTVE